MVCNHNVSFLVFSQSEAGTEGAAEKTARTLVSKSNAQQLDVKGELDVPVLQWKVQFLKEDLHVCIVVRNKINFGQNKD